MILQALLAQGIARLKSAEVPDPAGDARHLLAAAIPCTKDRLSLYLPNTVTDGQIACFQGFLTARERRQPVAQILGHRLFWGRAFKVTSDVLDPRPETETLIAAALEKPGRRILDLGSGTGCIALTLLAEWPDASSILTDISPKALAIARENAMALGVASRAQFVLSNWWKDVSGHYDLVVSNPPYITETEMAKLAPDVRDWEPHLALTPGGDGLDAYRRIAAGLRTHMEEGGRALLEIGHTQGADVLEIMKDAGPSAFSCLKDMNGHDRIVSVTF